MFDACASRVKVPGNMKHRRTGWAPIVLKAIVKVVEELPPVGQRASALCPPHKEHGFGGGAPPHRDCPPPPADSV